MTYRELCQKLTDAQIEDAQFDATVLMEHYLGIGYFTIRSAPERDYTSDALEAAVARRCAREPLQYILGEWDFYRQTYEVSPDCLIPRSDTEILVGEAIRRLPQGARFADLCTGSGCIAISTLAERPDTQAVAVDKFTATLALAERNAVRNGVRERFTPMLADVLDEQFCPSPDPLDAILCNPPYIVTSVLQALAPEVKAEPIAALDGGEDGLIFYRRLLETQQRSLKPDGFFLFEIGYDQADALVSLGKSHGFTDTRVLRDHGGNDRVVYLAR